MAVNFQPQHVWKPPGRSSRSCCQFFFPHHLSFKMWPQVQLLCVEGNAPCQWDLAIDKAKPPMSAVEWHGNDQTDLQYQAAIITTRSEELLDGKRGPGRPKTTWKQLSEKNCREWKRSTINPNDRHTWKSVVRSAMLAASQLATWAQWCGCCPCTCTLIKNPMMMFRALRLSGHLGPRQFRFRSLNQSPFQPKEN